ncbi:MAG TPA: class I SAM-dependent methyltransferase [Stellaceae bacterium]|nr:class I SAM-dependent methyltransferase [Stellaceae bacterium]
MGEFERWEGRFAAGDYIFGKAPNYFLAACQPLLPKSGAALSIADGEGRNGVWLALQGLTVTTIDFSPTAQAKARRLAEEMGVEIAIHTTDVHAWAYPKAAFDVVVEIFAQFSTPAERQVKWANMKAALKPGGLLVIQGYTPKQLEYGTGGPKELSHLYTREMLSTAFADLHDLHFTEEELEMHEGGAHHGMSAVIGMTARK